MIYLSFLLLLFLSTNWLFLSLGFFFILLFILFLLGSSILMLFFLNLLLIIILLFATILLFHLVFINLILLHLYSVIVPLLLPSTLTIHSSCVSPHFTHISLTQLIRIHFCYLLFIFLMTFEIFI